MEHMTYEGHGQAADPHAGMKIGSGNERATVTNRAVVTN